MMTDNKLCRADEIAVYVRVSTEEQAKHKEGSLTSQTERCIDWLKAKGYTASRDTVRLYSEQGRSGKNTDRPEFKRMMRDVRRGLVKLIVFAELSRISRSTVDFLNMSAEWQDRGVRFASLREQVIDTTTPGGNLIGTIMIAFAQFEREQTALRTKLNMRSRAKRGLFNGGKVAIGYKIDPEHRGHLLVDDEYAPVVQEAFDLYLEHGAPGHVAKVFDDRGLRTPVDRPFNWMVIHHMLQNPTYLGLKEVNRNNRGLSDEDQAGLPEEERYYTVPAVWPALIDEDTWDRTQALREANKRHRNATTPALHHDYVLTGVVRCRCCGTALEGGGAKDQKYHYYRHPKRSKQPECPQGSYQAEAVEEAVFRRLKEYVDRDSLLDSIVEEANKDVVTGADVLRARVEDAERRVRSLTKERDSLFRILTSAESKVPPSFWDKANAKEEEIESAKAEVTRLKAALAEAEATEIRPEAHREALRQFNEAYEHLNPHERRKLLAHFLDAVDLDGDRVHLKLFGEDPEVRGLPKTQKGCGNQYRTPSHWLRKLGAVGTTVNLVQGPEDTTVVRPSVKTESARAKRLREREERTAWVTGQPKSAADALRTAMAWDADIARTGATRASIARRERITRARVTQIMSLLDLPESLKTMLLDGHEDVEGWSIRRALSAVG